VLPPSRPGVDRFKIFIGAANAAPKQPAACAETAAGDDSDAIDLAACAAVTELDDATACEAIATDSGADAADAKACTYALAALPGAFPNTVLFAGIKVRQQQDRSIFIE
jgi:hypothetical protein